MASTATDCIDKVACSARAVAASNIRGYAHGARSHLSTDAGAASQPRRLDSVIAGRWQQSGRFYYFDFPVRDLGGARLGIIGEGVLGQRVADIGRAFGMQPMFAARKGRDD